KTMAVLDDVKQLLEPKAPEAPPPGGMTFEQRAWLIGKLHQLKERGDRRLDMWLHQLRSVLSRSEATKYLVEALPALKADQSEEERGKIEEQASAIARSAIEFVESHPASAFGGDVNHLIVQSVEQALSRSSPVRLVRWLLPTLLIVFGGGLLW